MNTFCYDYIVKQYLLCLFNEYFHKILFLNRSLIYNYIIGMNPGGYERYGNFIINKNQSLGSGQYGHVWKGYLIGPNKQLQPVAIKQSFKETSQNIKQIQTLQILKHPNIIRYIDYKVSGNTVFMVMELCDGGTLDDLLFQMQIHDTNRLIKYYSQIVKGIKFMYEKKILHRDLKPENLLVKKNVIKIADFGTSKMNSSNYLKTLAGTPMFASPELLQVLQGQKDTYTEKSQIWALGLILYLMFNYDRDIIKSKQRMKQSLPWKGRNQTQLLKNIKKEALSFKKPYQVPQQIKKIITKMLVVDANERMSFEEFFNLKIFDFDIPIQQNKQQIFEQKTINQIARETIDWQLQQLLSLKVNQNTVQQENQECRQFYELLIEQFSEVYEIKYYELMYELQHQYYQITNRLEERQRILQKYYERKHQFHTFQAPPQTLQQNNDSQFMKNQSGIILAYKPNIENIMPLPGEKLISQAKQFIKDNLPSVFQISSPKKVKNITQDFREMLFTIYDFYTLITIMKSWEIKRKFKISIAQYRKLRRTVSSDKIINRIRMAADSVPI